MLVSTGAGQPACPAAVSGRTDAYRNPFAPLRYRITSLLLTPAMQLPLNTGDSFAMWNLDLPRTYMQSQVPPWTLPPPGELPSLHIMSSSEPSPQTSFDERPDGADEPRFTGGPYADWTFSDVAEEWPGHYFWLEEHEG